MLEGFREKARRKEYEEYMVDKYGFDEGFAGFEEDGGGWKEIMDELYGRGEEGGGGLAREMEEGVDGNGCRGE